MVDTSNAFKPYCGTTYIISIRFLPILINTYRSASVLYIADDTMFSEGTTQGDPLAMPMNALATLPLVEWLSAEEVTQVWYADDACTCGSITNCIIGGSTFVGWGWVMIRAETINILWYQVFFKVNYRILTNTEFRLKCQNSS